MTPSYYLSYCLGLQRGSREVDLEKDWVEHGEEVNWRQEGLTTATHYFGPQCINTSVIVLYFHVASTHVRFNVDRNYFRRLGHIIASRLRAGKTRDTSQRRKKRSCRLALYEARISRHEIAATRENLRGFIMGRGRVGSQDEPRGEREKERTGAWRQVGSTSGPREWGPSLLFTETDRRSNGAAACTSTCCNLVHGVLPSLVPALTVTSAAWCR